MNIVDDQLGRIASGNRFYAYQRNQWRYYLEAYLGGEDWKRGQHLTRYQLETDAEYGARLKSTPYENHAKAVIDVYNSFLFQKVPERDLGSLEGMPEIESLLEDADMEGRSLDSFMKDVATWSGVFGHAWIMVVKPDINALTRADEIAAGVRPYLTLLTPLNVLDWRWERSESGYYDLRKVKYIEDINGSIQVIKEWTPETITTWVVNFDTRAVMSEETIPNPVGIVPAVCAYNSRSAVRGIGVSDIGDIADLSKSIYNMLSEVEQTIRLDSHPSLVKTPETLASAGAGSIIHMPENMDPGLKPYLLEYNGASVQSIYQAIEHAVSAIDKMANTGGVRSTQTKPMSGIAMQTEFQLLNAKIAEKGNNLELAEEQVFQLIAMYCGMVWDGEISYPDSFSIQDEQQEYTNLQAAKAAATGPEALAVIDQMIIDLVTDDTDLEGQVPGPLTGGQMLGTNEYTIQEPGANPTQPGPAGSPEACPIATQDVAVNLKNRQKAIQVANYGPLNPAQPNRTFWMAKAKIFGTTVAEAKGSRCGNCAAFNVGPTIKSCIEQGLAAGGSGAQDAWDVVNTADLGYCEMFDFKCAATRTCDAWVTGGPVTN
jgi:hypothetical protein